MKVLSAAIVSFATLSLLSMYEHAVRLVSAAVVVRYVFNNGESYNSNAFCTKNDDAKLDAIFNTFYRRSLRATTTVEHPSINTNQTASRGLKTYPSYCKNYCARFAAGTCRVSRCKGYRRSLQTVNPETTCKQGLGAVTRQIDELISNDLVSGPCKVFLKNSTRNATCWDEAVYGEVTGYKVWNLTDAPTVAFKNQNFNSSVYSFCKSTVFNIEVQTNACVESLEITVVGPRSYKIHRSEAHQPFTVFSSSVDDNTDPANGKVVLVGRSMYYTGIFNVTVVPDGSSDRTKKFSFAVLDC